MAELGGQTVDFSALVSRAAEDSFLSLKELLEKSKSGNLSDTEKKVGLLKYIVKTQQRMLRLNVLAKWCQQVPLINYCQDLASTISGHDVCFTLAADSLFFMHEGLQQARAPIYDVPSAVEVLLTGSYQRLPKCIEDVGMQSSLDEVQKKPALRKLDMLVRSKLLEATLPNEITEVKVSSGTAMLRVDGEFKVLITLGYRGHLSMWRILHLELLVGERSGPVKLEVSRQHLLGDDLERRMSATENPLTILYSVLHELCVALVMDTVIRQAQALRQGRWKNAIRFELNSDSGNSQVNQEGDAESVSLKTPGLRLMYWLDFGKSSAPCITIEPGSDLQIKCVHSTFVIDPLTGKEAELSLDQSCIDVEKLLVRAISCNKHTRLLELKKLLVKTGQICQTADDVILQSLLDEPGAGIQKKDSLEGALQPEEPEVLRVRAYGSSFFTVGINIRSGYFLLQSSKNTIAPSILEEFEDALNQRSMSAAEVFTSLRCKSILHLFAAIGRFLGLEICEHGHVPNKLPKNLTDGTSTLLLAFPDCGLSHYLLMELAKDFKPIFKVVQTQLEPSGKAQTFSDLNKVLRVKVIDIEQMAIAEDEFSLSISDLGKFLSSFPSLKDTNQAAEHEQPELNIESSLQRTGSPSNFSSTVDEVFKVEKGTSAVGSHVQHGFVPMSLHAVNGTGRLSSLPSYSNGSVYFSNVKGPAQSSSFSSLSSLSAKAVTMKKLSSTKSDQDLTSVRSLNLVEVRSMDEDPRLKSPSRSTTLRASLLTGKIISGSFKATESSSLSPPASQVTDTAAHHGPFDEVLPKQDKMSLKRTASDLLSLIPSLQCVEGDSGNIKRRKTTESASILHFSPQTLLLSGTVSRPEVYNYGSLIAEANKGNAPSSIYILALLRVVRHCSLCIKHAQLTSQMEALEIPFVEEVGSRNASSNIWFRLPFAYDSSWQHICLRLGRPGRIHWDVKINDQHFRDLWELQNGKEDTPWGSGVHIANSPDVDSHIHFDPEGVVLSYQSVEANSIQKLVADIRRLSDARMFSLGMCKLLSTRADEKAEDCNANLDVKEPDGGKCSVEPSERFKRSFKIEAVGLTSLWFSFGSGVLARFVVEWESGKDGCTMHVSPDHLWPHTKFLEDFINGAEVASLLDCIRLTAGPLHALAAATRPARAGPATGGPGVSLAIGSTPKQSNYLQQTQTLNPAGSDASNSSQPISSALGSVAVSASGHAGHAIHGAAMLAAAGRGGPGIVPSSLLPIDVSVVLRGPYWIRIIYRKRFAVDMRCFAGDQVWLQPATPPKAGASVGGSLPCPQFRPFIMEHVAQELNGLEPNLTGSHQAGTLGNPNGPSPSSASLLAAANGSKENVSASNQISRVANQVAALNRAGNAVSGTSAALGVTSSGLPVRRALGAGVPAHVRGELNTAIIGLGDDGGYGGGWVPLVALKKVLRGILKYLGVLWLFAQLPELLREILGSLLKENEGALLNLDQEQPALRFFVGGYVFAVSVHRVQLLLQVLSVKRFHHQQQQQQQQNSSNSQEELTQAEIGEICDYFSRRVASEPYDASRVASFITLLTLPISVLREFLKLIAWKKVVSQTQGGETAPAQKPRIELCLENHTGSNTEDGSSSAAKSNIHYDRPHNSVDFALTIVLDPAHIPQINAAGGAAWLPYCVSVRLRYSFSENPSVTFLGMEGSHGGRACWTRVEDWDKCKQRVARTVEVNGSSAGDTTQGRLRVIADSLQRTLHLCLQSLREGAMNGNSG